MPRAKKKKARPKPSRNLECGGLAAAFEPAALARINPCSQPITVRVRSGTANRGCEAFPNLINSRRLRRRNTNKSPVPPLILKLHDPSHQRIKRIVLTLSHIHQLPAKALNSHPLSEVIPALPFSPANPPMYHDSYPLSLFPVKPTGPA